MNRQKVKFGRVILGCLLGSGLLGLVACGGDDDDTTPGSSPGPTEVPTAAPTEPPAPTPTALPDSDGDGVVDSLDNCLLISNADQANSDGDEYGDVCDSETCDGLDNDGDDLVDESYPDKDGDGLADCVDACPNDPANDTDDDGFCDDVDKCPEMASETNSDSDNDGKGDACDPCPYWGLDDTEDGDGVCGNVDNCRDVANADQLNSDGDALGDACDECDGDPLDDADNDGLCADVDNCPSKPNPNQMDTDQDGLGDECDECPYDSPDDPDGDGECGTQSPEPAADASLYFFGTNPDDGYQAVTLAPSGRIYFSEVYGGDVSKVHVTITSQFGEVLTPDISIYQDEARFYPTLRAATDYCMIAEVDYQEGVPGVWPLKHVACFTTREPCGVAMNVGYDTNIRRLGSNNAVTFALNNAVQFYGNDYPVAMLLTDVDPGDRFSTLATRDIVVTLGSYDTGVDGDPNTLRLEGYTSTFDACDVQSDGDLICTSDKATFPICYEYEEGADFCVNLYVTDPEISGRLQSDGAISTMDTFSLNGIVTDDAVKRLEEETGFYIVSDVIEYDLDMDGDGVDDAASFLIETDPQPLTLEGSVCE